MYDYVYMCMCLSNYLLMYLFIRRVTGVYKQTNISLRASESFVGGDPTFGQIF